MFNALDKIQKNKIESIQVWPVGTRNSTSDAAGAIRICNWHRWQKLINEHTNKNYIPNYRSKPGTN